MVNLVEKELEFKFVDIGKGFTLICEYIEYKGEPLTNPLEKIFNCLGDISVLTDIAHKLGIDSTDDNLEVLFETIIKIYNNLVESNSNTIKIA